MEFFVQYLNFKIAGLVATGNAIVAALIYFWEGVDFWQTFIISGLSPIAVLIGAWLVHRREKQKRKEEVQRGDSDSAWRYATDRQNRLDEVDKFQRQEERKALIRKAAISAARAHVFANAQDALTLANDILIGLLRQHAPNVAIPTECIGLQVREHAAEKLMQIENEEIDNLVNMYRLKEAEIENR